MTLIDWTSPAERIIAPQPSHEAFTDANDMRAVPSQEKIVAFINAQTPRFHADRVGDLPGQLVHAYADSAVRHARAEQLDDDLWFASVFGLQGVWGEGSSAHAAIEELRQAIPGWVAIRREIKAEIPPIEGFDLNL